MSSLLIGKRYAAAVLRLAVSDDEIQKQQEFLDAAAELFRVKSSRRVLVSPAMPKSLKRELLNYAAKTVEASKAAQRLSEFLLEVNRVALLPEIREGFLELVAKRRQEVRLEVTTAVQLSPSRAERVASEMGRLIGKRVSLAQRQDPQVLGGLVLRFDNKVLDLSVQSRVKKLLKNAAL